MLRKSYPPEFKQGTVSLVLDQGYTRKAASEVMGVGYTALDHWVKQLCQESQGAPAVGYGERSDGR
jgi:transposase